MLAICLTGVPHTQYETEKRYASSASIFKATSHLNDHQRTHAINHYWLIGVVGFILIGWVMMDLF